jgi:hypothetical protein
MVKFQPSKLAMRVRSPLPAVLPMKKRLKKARLKPKVRTNTQTSSTEAASAAPYCPNFRI